LKRLERNWNRWKNDRKEGEKKYMKKLEESLEWNKRNKQMSKRIWGGQERSFSGSRTLRWGYCCGML